MENRENPVQTSEYFWLPLDNAAKIFPAVVSDELTMVFRISAVLRNRININNLFAAVEAISERFPYYKVKLKKGFFWYYLEHTDIEIPVEFDNKTLCRRLPEGKYMFRILAASNRLSIEFSHILTDGTGALKFFTSLLAMYFEKSGMEIPSDFKFHRPEESVRDEEFEDSYSRYFQDDVPPMPKRSKAFHIPFPLRPVPRFNVLYATFPIHEIKTLAAKKGVNVTVYLTAVYLFVLQDICENRKTIGKGRKNRRLRIQIPINLRNIYPSETMRNFSLFVMPEVDLRLGHYTFDEIIKTVYHQIQLETDEKLVNKILARNVGSEKKLLVRSIPLFLKSLILYMKYYSLGARQYSGVVTNLGKVDLPPVLSNCIERFIVTAPPPNKKLKINCAIIGFDEKLVLSFGNITTSREFERKFLKFLSDQDVKVRVSIH